MAVYISVHEIISRECRSHKVSLHCFLKSTNSTDLDNVSTMYLQCLAELSNMLSRPVFGILDSDILDETKF
ncbi:hypothetical protein V1477_016469 [Vespula maculifrons]|uniref:Uncharacterized protein n=1 Tax=Vespula maculifrons TaxID=7453 RepID=A0ABD2B973_VESMC